MTESEALAAGWTKTVYNKGNPWWETVVWRTPEGYIGPNLPKDSVPKGNSDGPA